MKVETIKTQLKSLHLSAAAKEVEEVLAEHGSAMDLSWLAELLERELDARRERAIARRIENAEFPEVKALEGFDWGFNRKLDKAATRNYQTWSSSNGAG
jgi:DNA replication protein DnaC